MGEDPNMFNLNNFKPRISEKRVSKKALENSYGAFDKVKTERQA